MDIILIHMGPVVLYSHPLFQGAKLITNALCSRAGARPQLEKFTLQESRIAMANHHLGVEPKIGVGPQNGW